jgi:hypothetical protein
MSTRELGVERLVALLIFSLSGSASCGGAKPAESPPPAPVVETRTAGSSSRAPTSSAAASPPTKKVEDDLDPDIPDGPAKDLGASEIEILIQKLPLRPEVVNFEGIDKFLLLYAPFSSNKKLVRGTRRYFRNARSLLLNEPAVFSLNSGASDLTSMLAPPKPNQGVPYTVFLSQMHAGLNAVQSVLLEFQSRTEGKLSKPQVSRLNAQVEGSSSIVQGNIDAIATLESQAQPAKKYPY